MCAETKQTFDSRARARRKYSKMFDRQDEVDPSEKKLPAIGKETNQLSKHGESGYVQLNTRDYHVIMSYILEALAEATRNDDGYK